jgi:endonuclease-3
VGSRLGLFRPGASFEEAHDELLRLCSPQDCYELHVLLIRHGRRTCTARAPRCPECPLRRMCPYGRERLRG